MKELRLTFGNINESVFFKDKDWPAPKEHLQLIVENMLSKLMDRV